ncbi:MAG: right-handed parallel beta-helix repeat-containing protein [Candidatus Heimdallarchaeota archaeon]|nr:right-handed parallel beta-helix repeat-containing protein [Candidatus Heimdallarchaeota archaeon]
MRNKMIVIAISLLLPLFMPVVSTAIVTPSGSAISHADIEAVNTFSIDKNAYSYYSEWNNVFYDTDIKYTIEGNDFNPIAAEDLIQVSDYELENVEMQVNAPPVPKDHRPFFIDSEKVMRRLPGSGTFEDPYLIENWNIESTKTNLIQIQDTTSYLVIRNNILNGLDAGFTGILIINAENVRIENNQISNTNDGIVTTGATGLQIVGNTITNNANSGMNVEGANMMVSNNIVTSNYDGMLITSFSGVVDYNTVSDNGNVGITLAYSDSMLVSFNTIYNNGNDGLFLLDSNNNFLTDNEIFGNGFLAVIGTNTSPINFVNGEIIINARFAGSGVFLDPSMNNVVDNNNIYDNAGMGLYLQLSDGNTISNNNIFSNEMTGLFTEDSDSNWISGNIIDSNGNPDVYSLASNDLEMIMLARFAGSGVFLDPSHYNTLVGNTFSNNLGDGLVLEYSTNTFVDGNYLTDNGFTGVFFIDSDSNTISNNMIAGNGAAADLLEVMSGGDPFAMRSMARFAGSGVFLDPSFDNVLDNNIIMNNVGDGLVLLESDRTTISNNNLLSNGGDGVALYNSSSNSITNNLADGNGYIAAAYMGNLDSSDNINFKLMARFAGSGIYLDPSPDNVVTGNTVSNNAGTGIHLYESNYSTIEWNTVFDNVYHGIFLQDSSYNGINWNVVDNNGGEITGLTTNARFAGSGVFLDPSVGNTVTYNNITNQGGDAVFVEASGYILIEENRLFDNLGYGVNIDPNSGFNAVTKNNFKNNNGETSQARDDGFENSFYVNYWDGHDNNDTDFDGYSDDPYFIDGVAFNEDGTPSNIPNGLNLYFDALMESSPRTLNAGSDGTPITFKVWLRDGYRALNINNSRMWINNTVEAMNHHIIDIQTFTVTFPRQGINDLINALGIGEPFDCVLKLSGYMNDELLYIEGYDTVTINQTDIVVPIIAAAIPLSITGKKGKDKLSKYLN